MVNCEGCIHKDLCKANGVEDEYVAESCSFYEKKIEQKWIPISEGMPPKGSRCWVTTVDGRVEPNYSQGECFLFGDKKDVVAWMLSEADPEPYGTEISDEEAIDILEEVKELDDSMYALNPKYKKALDMVIKSLKEKEYTRRMEENGYMMVWTRDVPK